MPLLRALLVWAALSLLVAAGLGVVAGSPGPTAAPTFDGLLVRLSALVLVGGLGWLWVVGTVVLAGAVRGADLSRAGAWAGPVVVRRVVLAACGLALAGAAVPAVAAPGPVPGRADVGRLDVRDLAGLPLPERAVAPGLALLPTAGVREVVVRPGDTLWALAADALPAAAGDAAVDAAWRAVYRANRLAIGADPDLIRPGDRLRVDLSAVVTEEHL